MGKDEFADLAYDSVIHHFLREKLQSTGMNWNLLHLLQALYRGVSCNVGFLTDTFVVFDNDVSILLHSLFFHYLMRATKVGISFGDVL